MKVIFLDIDGVLNSNVWNEEHPNEISNGTLIDKEKVELLSNLVKVTGAKLILHSGWRFWFDRKLNPLRKEAVILNDLLIDEGIRIAGVTPDFSTEEIKRTRKFSLVKAKEILGWLNEQKEVTEWIVIDDLDLHSDEIKQHQIKTDPNLGLTSDNVKEAKKLLMDRRCLN